MFEFTRACESARARIEAFRRKDEETMAKKNGRSKNLPPGVPPDVNTFKRPLPVALTDEEVQAKGRKAAKLQDQCEGIEAKLKTVGKELRDELKAKRGELRGLLHDVSNGTEDRDVLCWEQMDYNRGEVRVIRADDGKTVESRTMTPDERQEKLPIAKPQRGRKAQQEPAVDPTVQPSAE
jgi:hypothetical protein